MTKAIDATNQRHGVYTAMEKPDNSDSTEGNLTEDKEQDNSMRPGEGNHFRPEYEIGDESEYSQPDLVYRRTATIHSYHDSDSEMGDFCLDFVWAVHGTSLDKSDADSWDWTFHDENVSDLDINKVPLSALASEVNIKSTQAPVQKDVDDPSPGRVQILRENTLHQEDTSHRQQCKSHLEDTLRQTVLHRVDTAPKEVSSQDEKVSQKEQNTPSVTNNIGGLHKQAHQRKAVRDCTTAPQQKDKLTFSGLSENRHDKKAKNTFLQRQKPFKGRQNGIEDKNRNGINPGPDIVYFEDPQSYKIRKARLKYLTVNCRVETKTKNSRWRRGAKATAAIRQKNSITNSPITVKESEKKNPRLARKLGEIEAKFVASPGPTDIQPTAAPMSSQDDRSLSSSPSSTSKSETFLPPVITRRREMFRQRTHSLNDVLSQNRMAWAKQRGRSISKLDLIGNSCTDEGVARDLGGHLSLGPQKRLTGIERFRHLARMVLIMLKAVGFPLEKPEETNYNFLSWTVVYDVVLGISRLNYDSGALTFDPLLYRANKESTLSQEIKDILRLPSDQRSEAHIHTVMVSFRNVIPSFSEFPKRIQQSMIKVCTYEKFEAGRVIIRQGHRAENFYFIISGCAVVTQVDSGANHVHTTNVLGKGNSFGELAFLDMAKRSATVTCRDDVELICIEREDFIDIFMRPHGAKEPDHIAFLKKVDILQGWPVTSIPNANPKICAFTYVRRGVILCHDSAKSDWIIVVYSGSCKVLKALDDGPAPSPAGITARPGSSRIGLAPNSATFSKIYTTNTASNNIRSSNANINTPNTNISTFNSNINTPSSARENGTRDRVLHSEVKSNRVRRHGQQALHPRSSHSIDLSLEDRQEKDVCLSQIEHLAHINKVYNRKHFLPVVLSDDGHKDQDNLTKKVSLQGSLPQTTGSMFRPKRQSYGFQAPALPQLVGAPAEARNREEKTSRRKVFVEITRLETGDVFGLEHVVLQGIRDVASCSLVSDGAEVVLISKAFFRKHLTEGTLKRMRQMIRPLPSEKMLQKKLYRKKSWDIYKSQTLARHFSSRNRL